MKRLAKYLFLISFFCAFLNSFSQDTIFLKDLSRLTGSVKEISEDKIRYKKTNNPDGPDYTLLKTSVAKIVYANGTFEIIDTSKIQTSGSLNQIAAEVKDSGSLVKTSDSYIIPERNSLDTIVLKDLTYIVGKIMGETSLSMKIKPEGSPWSEPDLVAKKKIEKIIYANRKVLDEKNGSHLIGQDTIFLKNFSRIIGNITELNTGNIKIKPQNSTGGSGSIIERTSILKIVYSNGNVEYQDGPKTELVKNATYLRGMSDAEKYYKHPGGQGATFVTSFLTGGILGLIPAIACSSTTPQIYNLGCPDKNLMQNDLYMQGYIYRAKKMKQGRVWRGYGFGVLSAVMVGILINSH